MTRPDFPWTFIGIALLVVVALLVLGPFVLLAPLVAGVFLVGRARTLSDALFSIVVLLFGLYACRVVVAARLGSRWSKIPIGPAVAIGIAGGAYAALLSLLGRVPESELAAMVRRFAAYHEAVAHWDKPIKASTSFSLVALTALSYLPGAGDLATQCAPELRYHGCNRQLVAMERLACGRSATAEIVAARSRWTSARRQR